LHGDLPDTVALFAGDTIAAVGGVVSIITLANALAIPAPDAVTSTG